VSRRRPQFRLLAGICALLVLAGCTSGTALGSSGTVTLGPKPGISAGATTTPRTPTSVIPTPVTPNGLLTGTGVDDSTIMLGLLVDARVDRGFSTGVDLWRRAVNTSGGICGRTIDMEPKTATETMATGYARIAGSTLGLITLPDQSDRTILSNLVSADQFPTLALAGSSAELSRTGPVVIAATEDIKAINALAYLRSNDKLPEGSTLGVLTDTSTDAANALAGASWWAARNGVTLVRRSTTGSSVGQWPGADAVLVLAGPVQVQAVLQGTGRSVDVVTNLDGYDPAQIPNPKGRLLVSLAAPAYGSDNPGAAAVANAFVASGQVHPGPEAMSGYGVAATWGRLLVQACAERALTHAGVRAAMTTVGPASVDSLFGPSDPGLVVKSALPATRVSSVALADPKAPGGLRPLIWLQAAPGISDYEPPR
jgi:hypothetical protein